MPLPLEDTFADLIGKAQKGLHLSDSTLAERAAIPLETLAQLQEGVLHEAPRQKAGIPDEWMRKFQLDN